MEVPRKNDKLQPNQTSCRSFWNPLSACMPINQGLLDWAEELFFFSKRVTVAKGYDFESYSSAFKLALFPWKEKSNMLSMLQQMSLRWHSSPVFFWKLSGNLELPAEGLVSPVAKESTGNVGHGHLPALLKLWQLAQRLRAIFWQNK